MATNAGFAAGRTPPLPPTSWSDMVSAPNTGNRAKSPPDRLCSGAWPRLLGGGASTLSSLRAPRLRQAREASGNQGDHHFIRQHARLEIRAGLGRNRETLDAIDPVARHQHRRRRPRGAKAAPRAHRPLSGPPGPDDHEPGECRASPEQRSRHRQRHTGRTQAARRHLDAPCRPVPPDAQRAVLAAAQTGDGAV